MCEVVIFLFTDDRREQALFTALTLTLMSSRGARCGQRLLNIQLSSAQLRLVSDHCFLFFAGKLRFLEDKCNFVEGKSF